MSDRCQVERAEVWSCYLPADHDGPHRPETHRGERAAILAESESLNEALFDLANLFLVPLTNNGVTWFEDGDESKPVFCVGEFIDAIRAAAARFPDEVAAR